MTVAPPCECTILASAVLAQAHGGGCVPVPADHRAAVSEPDTVSYVPAPRNAARVCKSHQLEPTRQVTIYRGHSSAPVCSRNLRNTASYLAGFCRAAGDLGL